MKKILWLSRHQMTKAQVADLNRIYGEIEVKTFDQSVSGWKDVAEAGAVSNMPAGKESLRSRS